jgi:uncharacterized integral membrane protein (TIGR00697 family)
MPTLFLYNELVFVLHTVTVSLAALAALRLGKEALVAFICLVCVLANFFVVKETTLFTLHATCSDAFTIGATLGLNLLQEYYGREITRKTIWINFFLLIFYAIISQVHLLYIPSAADSTQAAFTTILSFMPRIVIASFSVYFIAHMIDYTLYGFLKQACKDKFFILRNYGSIAISQLVDTILFSFFGLYGIISNIGEIMVVSYAIKLVAIALATPFIALSRRFMRNT